jgi:hypothetical protein
LFAALQLLVCIKRRTKAFSVLVTFEAPPNLPCFRRFVKDQIHARESGLEPAAFLRLVDLAAPFRVIHAHASEAAAAPPFEVELHEAASEGGVLWMQVSLRRGGERGRPVEGVLRRARASCGGRRGGERGRPVDAGELAGPGKHTRPKYRGAE